MVDVQSVWLLSKLCDSCVQFNSTCLPYILSTIVAHVILYHSTISKHNINIARSGYTNFVHSGITIIMCQAIHSFSLSRFHIWRLCGIGIKAAQQLTTIQEGMSHTFGVFHRSQQVVSILLLNRMFHTFGNSSLAYIQWRLLNRSRVTARARRRELHSTSVLLVWAVSPSGYTVHCKY
jgi:hypothetical protein